MHSGGVQSFFAPIFPDDQEGGGVEDGGISAGSDTDQKSNYKPTDGGA